MGSFSIPINSLPPGAALEAPETVPVYYQGERVADAHFRDGAYAFTIPEESVETDLEAGKLHLWARFVDHFVSGEGAMVRHYFAIEIVEQISAKQYEGS